MKRNLPGLFVLLVLHISCISASVFSKSSTYNDDDKKKNEMQMFNVPVPFGHIPSCILLTIGNGEDQLLYDKGVFEQSMVFLKNNYATLPILVRNWVAEIENVNPFHTARMLAAKKMRYDFHDLTQKALFEECSWIATKASRLLPILRTWVACGYDVTEMFMHDNNTYLHYASDEDMVSYLVKKGCNINAPNALGTTPLGMIPSCMNGIREVFLKYGASGIVNDFDKTSLWHQLDFLAHEKNFADFKRWVYRYPQLLKTRIDADGNSVLHVIAESAPHFAHLCASIPQIVFFFIFNANTVNKANKAGKKPIEILMPYVNNLPEGAGLLSPFQLVLENEHEFRKIVYKYLPEVSE